MTRPVATDRSIEAIRQRAAESVVWSEDEGKVPMRVSDALWAAVRDRETLLATLDAEPCSACAGDGFYVTADPNQFGEPGEPYPVQCGTCGGTGRRAASGSPTDAEGDYARGYDDGYHFRERTADLHRAASGSPEPVLDAVLLAEAVSFMALRPSGHTGSLEERIPWFQHGGISHGADRPDCMACQWLTRARAALATHASPAALVPEGDQG